MIAEHLRQLTVQVHGRRAGGGSGVIWRSTGLIITNAHVARAPSAAVTLADGRAFEATVTARDLQRDLAILRLQASDLPVALIGDSSAVRVGELAFAVGNPLGIVGALTAGIIHALGPPDGAHGQGWIQADIHLAPGNSGGPLADAQGRIIGINSMVAGGLAFAIPSNAVERFLNGDGKHPRLGVTLRSVSMPHEGKRVLGLLVLGVATRGAAEAARIMIGDVLIGISGQLFGSPQDLSRALRHIGAGGRLAIDLIRGGEPIVCEVAVSASRSGTEAA
ncbi:MAG TPA: trypsin-like peptidase domain-containing protein [Candidatus Tectomicrobia bacterium]